MVSKVGGPVPDKANPRPTDVQGGARLLTSCSITSQRFEVVVTRARHRTSSQAVDQASSAFFPSPRGPSSS